MSGGNLLARQGAICDANNRHFEAGTGRGGVCQVQGYGLRFRAKEPGG